MKFILSVAGTVGVSVRADDVLPPRGYVPRELIAFLQTTYRFSVSPTIPPNFPDFNIPSFTFQSGIFAEKEKTFPIYQLASIQNGDIVTTKDTEIADRIMDDYLSKLDSKFGYRYASAEMRRVYQSNIVVQFDDDLAKLVDGIARIESILEKRLQKAIPFKIKRLAFGVGDIPPIQTAASIESIENSDLTIERRAKEPYEANRFFSGAPVSTSEHIRLLEEIDHELRRQ